MIVLPHPWKKGLLFYPYRVIRLVQDDAIPLKGDIE
jgi:hypothetical protein